MQESGDSEDRSYKTSEVYVRSADNANQVTKNAKKLRAKEGYMDYGSVYICSDRTLEEKRAYKGETEAKCRT